MKNVFTKYVAFLALAIGLSAFCFANQNSYYSETNENYYVQSGEVFVAPNGLYASIDGTLIQINTLCADDQGIYVPYTEILGKLAFCRFCSSWYDPSRPHPCTGPRD